MTSRPPTRYRFEEEDDDYFIPQLPKRDQNLEKAPAGDKGDFSPKPPEKTQTLNKDYLDASSTARRTSATGLAVLTSTSVAHSTGTARAPIADVLDAMEEEKSEEKPPTSTRMAKAFIADNMDAIEEEKSEEKPHARVGAVVVPGWSARNTSDHSTSTYDEISNEGSSPPPAVPREEKPLQATLVADSVTSYEEQADIESQVHSCMHREAEDIAAMVHKRIFENTAMAVVKANEDPASSVTTSEGDNRRKKKCILLALAVLVIAAAIGAGVGIALSKPPDEPTEPPDPLDAFRSVLGSVSEEGLDDPDSPQFKALNWIANEDPANTTVGITADETIKQRYVAALLYFALGGDNWINKYNFLMGLPICLWNQELLGIICDSANVRVKMLNMSKNGLSGSIPEEIGYFSDLSTIEMTDGVIKGTLPSSLVELNLLYKLNLTTNALTGTIPEFLYTHAQLTTLLLNDNSFTGTIPFSLGTSPQLGDFWVKNNKLTGSIPPSVGQSSVLWSVDLSGNSLTGTIPDFSPSSQVLALGLESNNLDGSIPSSIGNVHFLQGIWLANNTLEGTIPTELSQCQNLKFISFEINQLTGDIGSVISTLPRSLMEFEADTNLLSGTVPTSIAMLTNLDFLDLGFNNLNGTIPTELALLSKLESLLLNSNGFTGTVPASLAGLPLGHLLVFDNDLTGSLDAFCGTEVLVANTCAAPVEITCTCCTHCCDTESPLNCNEL